MWQARELSGVRDEMQRVRKEKEMLQCAPLLAQPRLWGA